MTSVYLSARSAKEDQKVAAGMPTTVFTLADFNCSKEKSRISTIFRTIVTAMMRDPDSAVLKKADVEKVSPNPTGSFYEEVNSLLKLFDSSNKHWTKVFNKPLCLMPESGITPSAFQSMLSAFVGTTHVTKDGSFNIEY